MLMRQRLYLDGKLQSTSKPHEAERVRKWIDNIEKDWSRHLDGFTPEEKALDILPKSHPLYGTNQGFKVDRISNDEVRVLTTEGKQLRFLNVEVK